MPNINTLFSNQSKDDKTVNDDSDEEENSRYVGGVSARGGGSGLAVLPDRNPNRSAIFQLAEQAGEGEKEGDVNRRIITMYRDGFTVDDGPYRRLDDPSNAEFLSSLARGITPRELASDNGTRGNIAVGLVDKRTEDYVETFRSFSGAGQSLGVSPGPSASGVIDPNTYVMSSTNSAEDGKQTSIQVRLLSGKRLVVKVLLNAPVYALVQEILASGDAGSDPFVLMGGFPPRQITDFTSTIQESGLANSSVTQKKA